MDVHVLPHMSAEHGLLTTHHVFQKSCSEMSLKRCSEVLLRSAAQSVAEMHCPVCRSEILLRITAQKRGSEAPVKSVAQKRGSEESIKSVSQQSRSEVLSISSSNCRSGILFRTDMSIRGVGRSEVLIRGIDQVSINSLAEKDQPVVRRSEASIRTVVMPVCSRLLRSTAQTRHSELLKLSFRHVSLKGTCQCRDNAPCVRRCCS